MGLTLVQGTNIRWMGDFDALTTYAKNDIVQYAGVLYIALDASTGSTPPSSHWATFLPYGFRWRGEWDDSATYQPNDVVQSNGSAYIALNINNNSEPPNTDWDLVVQGVATVPTGNGRDTFGVGGTTPMTDGDTTLTLSGTPSSWAASVLEVNGVTYEYGVHYTGSSTTLTLKEAPFGYFRAAWSARVVY